MPSIKNFFKNGWNWVTKCWNRLKKWTTKCWNRINKKDSLIVEPPGPLREFVYLDEVSLHSLLASQTGGIKEAISEAISKVEESELGADVKGKTPVGEGGFNSRYQTTNSRSIETSRKVVIQSLFKEFINLEGVNIHLSSNEEMKKYEKLSDLISDDGKGYVISDETLFRGELIEIKVELAVDPIFKMNTLISEFMAMEKSTPELFEMAGISQVMKDVGPLNRFLQHLLAGLIPIRARALDYCVIYDVDKGYIVHKNAVKSLNLQTFPLEVVGVTDQLSYWKDIRRVLFSAVPFTMLCRISRDGIHDKWTPVKLVDLIDTIAPDFRKHMDGMGQLDLSASTPPPALPESFMLLRESLIHFGESYIMTAKGDTSEDDKQLVFDYVEWLMTTVNSDSVVAQNKSFKDLETHIKENHIAESQQGNLDPESVRQLRKEARSKSGLDLFDNPTPPVSVPNPPPILEESKSRIIDTEIIAIYW